MVVPEVSDDEKGKEAVSSGFDIFGVVINDAEIGDIPETINGEETSEISLIIVERILRIDVDDDKFRSNDGLAVGYTQRALLKAVCLKRGQN